MTTLESTFSNRRSSVCHLEQKLVPADHFLISLDTQGSKDHSSEDLYPTLLHYERHIPPVHPFHYQNPFHLTYLFETQSSLTINHRSLDFVRRRMFRLKPIFEFLQWLQIPWSFRRRFHTQSPNQHKTSRDHSEEPKTSNRQVFA